MRKALLPVGILLAVAAILVALVIDRDDAPAAGADATATNDEDHPAATEPVARQTIVVHADASGVAVDTDHLAPGFVTIRLQPVDGDHSMQLIRMNDGVTLEQILDAMATDDFETVLNAADLIGGFVAPKESETYDLTVDLQGGTYGLVDFGGERKPNFLKGFATSFTVDDAERHPAPAPDAVATIDLEDFAITVPDALPDGTLAVRNTGSVVHELNFLKLADGKRMSDFENYVAREGRGPVPGKETTGVATIEPGFTVYVDLPFKAGNYVAACFTADAKNPPHVALGMYGGFTVD